MDKLTFLSFVFTASVLLSLKLDHVLTKPLVDDCQDHDMVDCARIRGTPVCREVWVYEYCPVSCGVCGMQIPGGNEGHTCMDKDSECDTIKGDEHESCRDVVVRENCPKTCGVCGHHHSKITHPPHLLKTTHNFNINRTTTEPPEVTSIDAVQPSSQGPSSSQELIPSSSRSFEATAALSSTTSSTPLLPGQSVYGQPSSQTQPQSSYGIVEATSMGPLPSNSLRTSSQQQVSSDRETSSLEIMYSSISSSEQNQIIETSSSTLAVIFETMVTTSSESTQQASSQPEVQLSENESSTTMAFVTRDSSTTETLSRYIQASSSPHYAVSLPVQMSQESSLQSYQESSPIAGYESSYQLNQATVQLIQPTSSTAEYTQSQSKTLQPVKEMVSYPLAESQMIYPTEAITDSQSSSQEIDVHNTMNVFPRRSALAQYRPSELLSSSVPTMSSSESVNPSSSESAESSVAIDVMTQLTHLTSTPAIDTSSSSASMNLVSNHPGFIQASFPPIQRSPSAMGYMQSQSNALHSTKNLEIFSVLESSSPLQTRMVSKPSTTSPVNSEHGQSKMIYPTSAVTDSQPSIHVIDGHNSVNQIPTSSAFPQNIAHSSVNSIVATIRSSVAITPSASQSTESSVDVTMKETPEMTSPSTESGVSVTDESIWYTSTTELPLRAPTTSLQAANGVSCRVCEDPFCSLGFESIVKCPDSSPYCMNTVQFDSKGKKTMTKRCVEIQECHQNLIDQKSLSSTCLRYDDNIFYTDLKCSFCCVSDGCNIYNVPKTNTRYVIN